MAVAATDNGRELPPRVPRGEMRERILDVALELFIEEGYDRTSLREIAERLGVTKAALYYHFEHKSDILVELHLRLHALGRDVLDEIERLDDREVYAAWPGLLDWFIDRVLENSDLFLLHQRNHSAFERVAFESERHRADNDDLEQRFQRILANAAIPLDQRVRMACSVAAVLGVLMTGGGLFGEVSTAEVAAVVRAAARSLLAAPAAAG